VQKQINALKPSQPLPVKNFPSVVKCLKENISSSHNMTLYTTVTEDFLKRRWRCISQYTEFCQTGQEIKIRSVSLENFLQLVTW